MTAIYHGIRDQGIQLANQAIKDDDARLCAKAQEGYRNAAQCLNTYLKYEKNTVVKDNVTHKVNEYLKRADQLEAEKSEPPPTEGGTASLTKSKKPGQAAEDKDEEKLRAGLSGAILSEKPNVKWDDVAGLEGAKDALKEAVILPVKFPHFFTGKRKPWGGILLYGPPGTGKSYLAKAVATEADSTFFSISSQDLVSKWMGESEKLVSQLFNMAREKAPSIIFIDEIDSLCGARGEGESEAARRIKTQLMIEINGVGADNNKVLVLAATNLPYNLDMAIRRRFDKRIYIPLPEEDARTHMFKIHLGDTPNSLTEEDFRQLGKRTEGYSGSDCSVVVKGVLMEPIKKVQDATHFVKVKREQGEKWVPCAPKTPGCVERNLSWFASNNCTTSVEPASITFQDFDKVLLRARPTVGKEDLDVYERFTKEFGEESN